MRLQQLGFQLLPFLFCATAVTYYAMGALFYCGLFVLLTIVFSLVLLGKSIQDGK